VFIEEMLNLHRGQGWDIMWRERMTCPTERQYRKMVLDSALRSSGGVACCDARTHKCHASTMFVAFAETGGLFRLAIRLMQAFSENKSNFIPLVESLALYFQIRDDYINLASASYMQNKSFCGSCLWLLCPLPPPLPPLQDVLNSNVSHVCTAVVCRGHHGGQVLFPGDLRHPRKPGRPPFAQHSEAAHIRCGQEVVCSCISS